MVYAKVPVVAQLGAKRCAGIDLHIPVDICIGFKLDHGKTDVYFQ